MRLKAHHALMATAFAVVAGGLPGTASALDLKLSHGFPSVHGLQVDFINPWIADLQKATNNDVKVTVFPAGSSFGALDRQLDQVKSGVVDIAMGLAVVPRDRMPRTALLDLPFLAPNRANRAIWSLANTDLAKDYEGLKLLGIQVDCSTIHTVKQPVRTLEDMKGLRLRVPSALGGDLVKAAGGVPVAMPQGEIYENLERNVIDGAITPWDVMKTLNLGEVTKHHTENYLFCGQLWLAMNKATYDGLSAAQRAAVDKISGDALIDKLDDLYKRWTDEGRAVAQKGGLNMTKLSDADMAKWKDLMKPAVEKTLADAEARGVKDIRQTFDNLNAAIKKYSGN